MHGVTKEISEKEIDTYAAYLQDEINYGKWFVVPAIRYDHHENYGSHTSPKLGVTYKAAEDFRVKVNYGKGFKAPTVQNLYQKLVTNMGPAGTITVNPDSNLKPETSNSWDVGIEKEWGKLSTSLTYFDTKLENMITTTAEARQLFTVGNGIRQHSLQLVFRRINLSICASSSFAFFLSLGRPISRYMGA